MTYRGGRVYPFFKKEEEMTNRKTPGWVLQKNVVGGIFWEILGDSDDACAERDIVSGS